MDFEAIHVKFIFPIFPVVQMFNQLLTFFHIGGVLARDGTELHYYGGRKVVAFISREKMSLEVIFQQLQTYTGIDRERVAMMYWCERGKSLTEGLKPLVDDNACLAMAASVDIIEAAHIYVHEILPEVPDDK